jgi:hypothetical protein
VCARQSRIAARMLPSRTADHATGRVEMRPSPCRNSEAPISQRHRAFSFRPSAPRLLPPKAQRLCSPFSEMQSSRVVPLVSAPAGCAAPYSTTPRSLRYARKNLRLDSIGRRLQKGGILQTRQFLGKCYTKYVAPSNRVNVLPRGNTRIQPVYDYRN